MGVCSFSSQSNGKAEAAVKIVKRLLKKESGPLSSDPGVAEHSDCRIRHQSMPTVFWTENQKVTVHKLIPRHPGGSVGGKS